jgi:GntR family transcriptional regulator/MocR family aminotransferase
MAIQWSGPGPELLLRLDRESHRPLRSQLETGLRAAIRDGRLPAGERRRVALIEALGRHAPAVRLTGLAAGFHAVAHLPASADEEAVVAEALRRSVGLYGMEPFRACRGDAPPQLVLGFGLVNERAIEAGIAAVADLLR